LVLVLKQNPLLPVLTVQCIHNNNDDDADDYGEEEKTRKEKVFYWFRRRKKHCTMEVSSDSRFLSYYNNTLQCRHTEMKVGDIVLHFQPAKLFIFSSYRKKKRVRMCE